MNRRSFLSLLPITLAGCVGTGVETPTRPRGPPNFFASYDWLPERSAYRVTFDRGNVITAENTSMVAVEPSPGDTTWWVGHDDAEAEYPLRPGDTIVVPAPESGEVRIAWSSPGSNATLVLDYWSTHGADSS